MLVDIENAPIAIELDLDKWKETLRELGDVPEIRNEILNQLLDVVGHNRREELTDQGMHQAILTRPGGSHGRKKVKPIE